MKNKSKSLKKIIALMMAIILVASCPMVYAYDTYSSWSCTLHNIPGGGNFPCDRTIAFSTYGEMAYLGSHSCTATGNPTWYATITCTNGTMDSKYVGYKINGGLVQQVGLHPVLTGIINGVSFHFAAGTTTPYNIVTVSGTVQCIT